MLIPRRLQRDGLCNHVGSFPQVFAGIAGILVIGVAEIDDRQILHGESDSIHVQDVSVVFGALLESAIVGQHNGAPIVGHTQERNVVLGDPEAWRSWRTGREHVDVWFDSDDRALVFRPRLGGSIGGLKCFEPQIDRIILLQGSIDEDVVS